MKHSWLPRRFAVAAIAALLVGLIPASVAMAAADHFVITGPTVVTRGASNTFTVKAMEGGSVDTSYTGEVTLTSDLGLSDAQEFVSGDLGVHNYSGVTLNATGAHTLTASDGLITDGSLAVTVRAEGLATHFLVTVTGSPAVGVPASFTVTAKDDDDTTDTTYNGTVHLTSSDGAASLPANYTFGAGTGTHTFTDGVTFGTDRKSVV